jgi:hypothetical protein
VWCLSFTWSWFASIAELTIQEKDWHDAIRRAWKWTSSPTGSQGIVLKEDQSDVNRLKGSKKYNDLTKNIALKLCTFFAQEWEDKNNRLTMRARQWWYKYSDNAEIIPPVKRLQNKRKRQEQRKKLFVESMEAMPQNKRRHTDKTLEP